MKWNEYITAFDQVLDGTMTEAPYDKEEYIEYVKLNNTRQNRWLKKMNLSDELRQTIDNIDGAQQWILITEPWCGDAAHLSPFINAIADASENIDLDIQLRDSEPFLIDQYLTNGGKSMPKLIVRDESGNDLFTWGPRPEACQNLMLELKDSDLSPEDKKAELQKWYNKDKGQSIQQEIGKLMQESHKKAVV